MTSDAKIGLLLGLVFIFIIAFLINGLPKFRSDNNNELTSTMFNSKNDGFGLAAKERKVIEQNEPIIQYPHAAHTRPVPEPDTRFEMALPNNLSDKKQTTAVEGTGSSKNLPLAKDKQKSKLKTKKHRLPKTYVVAAGDNLTLIARKFYGPEQGNRLINITRIFQANHRILKSPDEIYQGQKIIIPPLPSQAADKKKIAGVFPTVMFEKAESIGRRNLSDDSPKAKQSGLYTVREGDSLWQIGVEQLGDGTRYREIARMNADILEDENALFVGMRLRLPTH